MHKIPLALHFHSFAGPISLTGVTTGVKTVGLHVKEKAAGKVISDGGISTVPEGRTGRLRVVQSVLLCGSCVLR